MRARTHSLSSRLLTSLLVILPAAVGLGSHAAAGSPGAAVSATTSALGRRPMLRTGAFAVASTRDAVVIARDVLATHASWSAALELAHTRTFEHLDGSRVVALSQTIDGVPVMSRGARVLVEADGRVTTFTSALEERRPATTRPALPEAAAVELARKTIRLVAEGTRATLVIVPQPGDGEPRLAWAVGGGIAELPTRPAALIDATSGEVLQAWDRAVHERAAKVYEFNPKKTPTLTTTTLANTNPTTVAGLDNDRVSSRNCIDKKSVKSVMGLMAHVCDLVPTVTANATGDYTDVAPGSDTAPEDAYAELAMFYHTDKAYQHAKDLGFAGTKKLTAVGNLRIPQGFSNFDTTKIADPNLPLAPYDNAMFAPDDPLFSAVFGLSGDAMWFGQGTYIDFGYDGDVVYHEFGHYIVNETAKLDGAPHVDQYGVTVAPGALNEGLADINSFFVTGDPCTGEYASKGLTKDACIRNATNTQTMPDALVGEVHQDSNPFSAGTWQVYSTLDATKQTAFQRSWLKGLTMVPSGNLGYADLTAILVASITSGVDAATGDLLKQSYDARGIKAGDPRVRTYAGAAIKSIDPQVPLFALGTQTVTGTKVAPGVFQIKYDAPAGGTVTMHAAFTYYAGGSSNPFGGSGTPFKPVLLAKAGDTPITFKYSPFSHDGGEGACTISGSKATCAIDVHVDGAAGSTAPVYLMIGNAGQQDGNYDAVTITNDPIVLDAPVDADAGAETGLGDQPAAAASSSGCGCEVPGDASTSNGGLALIAASALAGLVLARRRR